MHPVEQAAEPMGYLNYSESACFNINRLFEGAERMSLPIKASEQRKRVIYKCPMGVLLALTLASCLEILQGDYAHRALARRLHAGDHRLRTGKRGRMADTVAHGCTSNLIAIGARGGAEGCVNDE